MKLRLINSSIKHLVDIFFIHYRSLNVTFTQETFKNWESSENANLFHFQSVCFENMSLSNVKTLINACEYSHTVKFDNCYLRFDNMDEFWERCEYIHNLILMWSPKYDHHKIIRLIPKHGIDNLRSFLFGHSETRYCRTNAIMLFTFMKKCQKLKQFCVSIIVYFYLSKYLEAAGLIYDKIDVLWVNKSIFSELFILSMQRNCFKNLRLHLCREVYEARKEMFLNLKNVTINVVN